MDVGAIRRTDGRRYPWSIELNGRVLQVTTSQLFDGPTHRRIARFCVEHFNVPPRRAPPRIWAAVLRDRYPWTNK